MRSKWEILAERLEEKRKAFENASKEITDLIERPFPQDGYTEGKCGSCGVVFATWADHDAHYLVDDERYLNLGNCPTRYNAGRLMPQLTSYLWNEAHTLNATKDKLKAKGTPITLAEGNKT